MNPPKADPSAPAARGTDQWPIFVLSLEGDEARRAPLLNSLAAMGFEPEVLIGVDGRNGLPDWAEAEVDRNFGWSWDHRPSQHLTDGELACALSHVRAYQKIVNEGLPGAIIFEDDAIVSETLKPFIAVRGYEAGEMVLLGHHHTYVHRFSKTRLCKGAVGHRLVATRAYTHGYALTRGAAAYIVDRALPIHARADWPCDISRLKSWAVDPQIAVQPEDRKDHSNLEAGRRTAHKQKPRYGSLSRSFSASFIKRMIRKRLHPERLRRRFGKKIA